MLNKLSKQQEEMLEVYKDKFIKLGLSTTRITEENKSEIEDIIRRIYESGGLKCPNVFRYFPNPNAMVDYAKRCGDKSVSSGFCYGSFDAGWLSLCSFFVNECIDSVSGIDKIIPLIELVGKCSYWIPYSEAVLISENPTTIFKNDKGLHNLNEPALTYKNVEGMVEFKPLYFLNGIEVPDWVVLTPTNQLDPKQILKITNVDVRREALRKISVEVLLEKLEARTLNTIVLTEENKNRFGITYLRKEGMTYDLLEMDFKDNMKVRYLKMDNPSIEHIHIEGVPNSCNTVEDALAFRNQKALEALGITGKWTPPIQLT